jgi:phospholipid transport system substrate-binding protein
MTTRWITTVVSLTLAVSVATAAVGPAPMGTVEELHARFIGVMKQADSLGFEGRAALLSSAVDTAFDLDFMAIKSLGLGGRNLDPADRERWIAAFTRFFVSSYARRFRSYSGQRFECLGEGPASGGQVVVRTRLVRSEDEDVRLDYRLRETPEGWKIIDVYARGTTSILAARRAEFTSMLEREGFEGLIASVEAHADQDQ